MALPIEKLQGDVSKIEPDRNFTVTVYDKQYEVILHPDIKNGGFWVECPELDVVSQGETAQESLDMIKEAVELHLEEIEGAHANTVNG